MYAEEAKVCETQVQKEEIEQLEKALEDAIPLDRYMEYHDHARIIGRIYLQLRDAKARYKRQKAYIKEKKAIAKERKRIEKAKRKANK